MAGEQVAEAIAGPRRTVRQRVHAEAGNERAGGV